MSRRKDVVVLGAGRIGATIARDLDMGHNVLVADTNMSLLQKLNAEGINIAVLDVTNTEALVALVSRADLVVNALPGFLGFEVLRTLIEAGKNVVDISFFPEDPFSLNDLAKKSGATAVIQCGVAPGLNNIICGHHAIAGDVVSFECWVGGLPKNPAPPFNYKAPYSPTDVIEMYTRPARIMKDGALVTVPALSGVELVDFGALGKLEVFFTDGLSTLTQTMSIPDMSEKTVRYPGHAELMGVFRDSGFFSEDRIAINGCEQAATFRDVTSQLLFPKWQLGHDEPEFTVMRVKVVHASGSKSVYDIYDERDPVTGFSSMSRLTGYTCTAVCNLMLEGKIAAAGLSGIVAPEFVGANEDNFQAIGNHLESRGIKITVSNHN